MIRSVNRVSYFCSKKEEAEKMLTLDIQFGNVTIEPGMKIEAKELNGVKWLEYKNDTDFDNQFERIYYYEEE